MSRAGEGWVKPAGADHSEWRKHAACARPKLDPEIMFPDSGRWAVAAARAVCEPCPVRAECLAAAMAEEGNAQKDRRHGVRGGLTGAERAYRHRRQNRDAGAVIEPPLPVAVQRPHAERTPQNVIRDNTVRDADGHLVWIGPRSVWIRARSCSPKWLAFLADRGREPEGRVLVQCGNPGCVEHIADEVERGRCGTRSGYQRHLARDEPIDDACRQANTDADNRLRRAGTSKVLA